MICKKIACAFICISVSFTAFSQNYEDSYERFKNERAAFFNEFASEREREFNEFKARYEHAFELFKKQYIAILNQEMDVIDLMRSDDGIKQEKPQKEPENTGIRAEDLKRQIAQDITEAEKMTPQDLLPVISSSADSVEQIKQAAVIMESINKTMSTETSELQNISDTVSKNTVILEKIPVRKEKISKDKPVLELPETNRSVPNGTPTKYIRISSPFGTRTHPITGKRHTHKGIDLAAPKMTPVYASADGKVTYAKRNGGYGNFIKINHGNGYKTAYAHLHKIEVKAGTSVQKGDLIGYVGSTGCSTGNHLHYEIYYKDRLIDPATTFTSL